MKKKIKIFTDGSCLGNPGPGGYGILIFGDGLYKEISNGYYFTTNNRMELLAAIIALESLEDIYNITLNTDSNYLRYGITKWIQFWKQNDWKTKRNKPVKNIDLWKQLDSLIKKHLVHWNWIKGHTNYTEHDRCDLLARLAAENPSTVDIKYRKC
ncbi:ribonuclease HI [Wigglesworthia glossinidia endosymbiont of Glossina morsitans morsitans (Yale colony)]|uniref:Ribonuclease H n=1 Tax=Wigglesworthia glossinidia endosymbiont of Glossina morsitans morsitans (Yale colony) TaxID=1142511 RepID=H6Q5M8_WIGGL|nr:ribonuclease HI [Wigglesworthia glossinidia]AFA40932.1 ribonuclease HI [Wigglesworthia glossinidia endosymbiont of Glossina morsitans morsitans (Yale colony)]